MCFVYRTPLNLAQKTPLPIGWGETSPKRIFACCTREPGRTARLACPSSWCTQVLAQVLDRRDAYPTTQVHGEGNDAGACALTDRKSIRLRKNLPSAHPIGRGATFKFTSAGSPPSWGGAPNRLHPV